MLLLASEYLNDLMAKWLSHPFEPRRGFYLIQFDCVVDGHCISNSSNSSKYFAHLFCWKIRRHVGLDGEVAIIPA